jgi:hypothetical protein
MNSKQVLWDSLCTPCNPSDSIPEHPNKEDLSTFGYTYGSNVMDTVKTENWSSIMKNAVLGKYVREVRGSKYARPWQN